MSVIVNVTTGLAAGQVVGKESIYRAFLNMEDQINNSGPGGPNGASTIGFTQSGTGAVIRDVGSKLQETVSVTDFIGADPTGVTSSTAAFTSAGSGAAAVEVNVPAGIWNLASNPSPTGNVTWIIHAGASFTGAGATYFSGKNIIQFDSNNIKFGYKGMFGYTDNALNIQSYGDTGATAPTGIQQANRFIAQSKGDNTTFRGLSTGYYEARDRSDVTGANKGVLYALSLSVVPSVARNNVPFDDVDGLTISNTTGVVGAKATDGIYLSNNTTAFGDKVTGTSQWYSIFTADCNADIGFALNGKISLYGLDFALANFVTGAAMRFPNASSLYWRNNANSGDLPVIGLDNNNVINLGGVNVSGTKVNNWFGTTPPTVQAGATYTVGFNDNYIIFNGAGCTVTLPAAGSFPGRILKLKTVTAAAVSSVSANVVPLVGGSAGTAILAATAGKWAELVSDGAVWQTMTGN